MKEILLTSSVLILAVFLVRALFQKAISRRVQYALWGLVLVRLLVPFQLPAMEHNVLTAAAPMGQAVETRMEEQMIYALPTQVYPGRTTLSEGEVSIDRTFHGQLIRLPNGQNTSVDYYSGGVVATQESVTHYFFMWPLDELLRNIWIVGMAGMALWFLWSNLRFRAKLCEARKPYSIDGCKYSVYLIEEGLPSPCLFGLFRPAIYLTPAAIRDEETLRHVLAHESTHARHLDPLWSFLRGVCLVVYWFDPLVWAAAFASRTDCELACDEGAVQLLGEEERLSYGKTLLFLIPVRKNPASPLLSATTMTSDKKKLTERIRRIAENRQTVHAALFAVIAIAVLVCALTFTGAKTEKEAGPTALSEEEIHWFNTEFFNGSYINIKNQFLSSDYKAPEYINLFELFYCGTGQGEAASGQGMTDEEYALLLDTYYGGASPNCGCDRLPVDTIDQVLLENIGMTLAETKAVSMGSFHYLADYDTYYHVHGDTNYRVQVVIAAGEREGSLLRLYYYDDFMDACWKCVTLADTGDGYWFVSNLPTEEPATASTTQLVLPAGEPDARVKLNNLTAVGPQKVSVTEADGAAVRAALGSNTSQVTIGNTSVVCWSDSANYHFSYGRTDGNIGEATFYDLLVCPKQGNPEEEYSVERFYNLLGHNGFVVTYWGDESFTPKEYGRFIVKRYYALKDGEPQLLVSTLGSHNIRADLDGDSINELCFSAIVGMELNLFFFRNNAIYGLDLQELGQEAYPHWDYTHVEACEDGHITVSGSYQREDGYHVSATRYLYFTGNELLFYKGTRETVDHVMGKPDVSADVLEIAKGEVERLYNYQIQENGQPPQHDPGYDDWRIEHLEYAASYPFPNGNLEVYRMNYEFHAANPGNVMLAGGMYHTEEDWVMPSYPGCYYLCIREKEGLRELLRGMMINDSSPGLELFDSDISRLAVKEGLVDSPADLEGKALLESLSVNTVTFLDSMTEMTLEEQKAVASKICYFRTSGPAQDQALYQDTMNSLVSWNTYELTTAQYDAWSLLFNYHVCQPAELTEEERYAALDAANSYMWAMGGSEACLDFDLSSTSIDDAETWRVVNMYTDSAAAVAGGYDHDTMTRMLAVQAVYDVQWDPTKSPADEVGRSARYLYMLPDENGAWHVWDQMGCAVPELYEMAVSSLAENDRVILQRNGSGYITEQDDYWRYRVERYPEDLKWTEKIKIDTTPTGNSLTLGDTEMGIFLRCWEENELVQVVLHDDTAWYTAEPLYADAVFDGRLYSMIRQWYDDVEWNALAQEIVIENRGQSYQEVAQEWVDRCVQTYLQVSPGSRYECTYVRAEASVWDWVPESAYPANTEGKERFYFGYTRIFVPATEKALQGQMAGNTTEYDGSLGEAPEGAYMCSRVGPMYLNEEGWRCDGVGTGI